MPRLVPEAADMEAIRLMESWIGLMVLLMAGAFLMRLLEPKGRQDHSRAPRVGGLHGQGVTVHRRRGEVP
jgi:hypothetical protein